MVNVMIFKMFSQKVAKMDENGRKMGVFEANHY
jgi:hypothetical protein